MEDVFKFLLIAAVIVIGLVKQYKKEAKKNAGDGSAMPIPETDTELSENWGGDTYGGYIPEGPKPEAAPPSVKKRMASSSKPFFSETSVSTHSMGTSPYNKPTSTKQTVSSPPAPEPQENDESEFTIHSAEEARRAIVWSEILQRKY